jgi:two-component system, cell cycle sensor histidine kinase and response regulator CckA
VTPGTVLIVDDDGAVRKLVARLLSTRGFKVLEAQNGLEAVQLYGSYHAGIALVIADVQMPVMGGIEGVRRMKELEPGLRAIFMSGAAQAMDLDPGFLFVSKPFTPDQLWRAVQDTLA